MFNAECIAKVSQINKQFFVSRVHRRAIVFTNALLVIGCLGLGSYNYSFFDICASLIAIIRGKKLQESSLFVLFDNKYINLMLEVLLSLSNLWFGYFLLASVLFIAAVYASVSFAFHGMKTELRRLISSGQIYEKDAFGSWNKQHEELTTLAEDLNETVKFYAGFLLLFSSANIMNILYATTVDCSSSPDRVISWTMQYAFMIVVLMSPATTLNDQVYMCSNVFVAKP